jgi:hypothetical protein
MNLAPPALLLQSNLMCNNRSQNSDEPVTRRPTASTSHCLSRSMATGKHMQRNTHRPTRNTGGDSLPPKTLPSRSNARCPRSSHPCTATIGFALAHANGCAFPRSLLHGADGDLPSIGGRTVVSWVQVLASACSAEALFWYGVKVGWK